MKKKAEKKGETGKDSMCWAISMEVGFFSCLEDSFDDVVRKFGGDKNICIVPSVLWFREPFWIYLILRVRKRLTWKTPVPKVRNNPL